MIGGDSVTCPDMPGAVGIITARLDRDDGVEYLVSWVLPDGSTRVSWHPENCLTKTLDNL